MCNKKREKNNLVGLPTLMCGPFLFSVLFAGHPISINGLFDDWDDVDVAYADQQGDAISADYSILKITYDSEFIFIYFNFFNGEFLMQDWNDFHLYIDADDDPSTGHYVHGIGAELDWIFGQRWGYKYIDGQQTDLYQNDLTLRIAPTITSTEFEIAISRESSALTMNNSQTLTNGKIVLSEIEEDGDLIPNESGGVPFTIDEDFISDPEAIFIERLNENDIRIVSYNTWNEGILDSDRQVHFKRILQALDPDIIALQEHGDWDYIDDIIQSWFPNEEWYASWTYGDLVILSRFAIIEDAYMGSERTMVALMDTEDELGKELLIFNSHLSCCDNNGSRQEQVDEFAGEWRDWIVNGTGPFEIDYGTPFVHLGDFNFVGYKQQVETIRDGDIENEEQYGVDFFPDWDSTSIIDLFPRHTHKRMGYTWRKDGSSFNPGKLDYIFYSDASIDTGKNYILNTLAMDNIALDYYELQWDDTQEASDHLPIIFDILVSSDDVGIYENQFFPEFPQLYPNYPNPFNSKTKTTFYLPYTAIVELSVIDVKGNIVKAMIKEKKSSGNFSVTWNGTNDLGMPVPTGVYFFLLKINNLFLHKKLLLLK